MIEGLESLISALSRTRLVGYADFMANFLAPIETSHSADNFGVALTIAEYVGGSACDLMLAARWRT
jgi:2-methylcitrate dehydratase